MAGKLSLSDSSKEKASAWTSSDKGGVSNWVEIAV
jgi:hypothetical protein